jgi:chromate transporter
MILLELLTGFLKIGLFSFGGAYAAIPLIREVVLSYGWMTDEKLSYMIAVSESTPGSIIVNMATYIGSAQAGVPGAAVATAAVVLPAFLIVVLITALVKKAVRNGIVQSALDGMKACMTGVILATGAYMILTNCIGSVHAVSADLAAVVLTAVLAAIYFGCGKALKRGMSPILLICLAGVAGVLAYGWK